MTSQTLSPHDTGEIRRQAEKPTRDLSAYREAPSPSPLPRPEAETAVLHMPSMPSRVGVFLPDYVPDAPSSPKPYPAPVPAGPKPRADKAMVPLLRPAAPLDEPYVDSRARRGLPPLQRKLRGYVGRHRKGAAR